MTRLVFLTLAAQVEDSLHVAVAVPALQLEDLIPGVGRLRMGQATHSCRVGLWKGIPAGSSIEARRIAAQGRLSFSVAFAPRPFLRFSRFRFRLRAKFSCAHVSLRGSSVSLPIARRIELHLLCRNAYPSTFKEHVRAETTLIAFVFATI